VLLDMDRKAWTVLFAAWLGWGFDCFDAILFSFVAPNCIPTLLGLPVEAAATSPQQVEQIRSAVSFYNGVFTSLLLVGWAIGGILFGRLADRLGRTRTLLLTMALYSVGTAACAFAPNLWVLALFRLVASLGIGGEWAAGAAMVAEVVPEKRRIEAGALLYTAAPLGLALATVVDHWIAGVAFADDPETSWRYVFLCGLIPTVVAVAVRMFIKEPERWQQHAANAAPPAFSELFAPEWRQRTLGGLGLAMVALLTWWSCQAFIPTLAKGLANQAAQAQGLAPDAARALRASWTSIASNCFNVGGLVGTLLTVPIAKHLGRRPMFALYLSASGMAFLGAFGLPMSPEQRIWAFLPVGLTIFGVFGSFTYYLPELYPTRLRGTGSGFCYNAGRVLASVGPFAVGAIAKDGPDAILRTLFVVGFVPLAGLLLLPFVTETRGQALAD
jgi:MFS family permease